MKFHCRINSALHQYINIINIPATELTKKTCTDIEGTGPLNGKWCKSQGLHWRWHLLILSFFVPHKSGH